MVDRDKPIQLSLFGDPDTTTPDRSLAHKKTVPVIMQTLASGDRVENSLSELFCNTAPQHVESQAVITCPFEFDSHGQVFSNEKIKLPPF
jgi:hypothetical protein